MSCKNVSYYYKPKSIILSSSNLNNITKVFILALSLFSFSIVLDSIQSFNKANAQNSNGKKYNNLTMNYNLVINDQIQSNLDKGHNNIQLAIMLSIASETDSLVNQFHMSNDGQKPTSINNPSCNGSTSTRHHLINKNNLFLIKEI